MDQEQSCGLSKYISQSIKEKFYIFHSPELGMIRFLL
jgi:hypothetical protein